MTRSLPESLACGRHTLSLTRPRIMGILNVTPDSFSDGGRFAGLDAALRQAELMVGAGADIIDIGGESTRPGADIIGEQQELDRVMPVIEAVAAHFDTIISIDTSKAAVMRAAAAAGAGLINDIRALGEPGALQAAADAGLPVCLMHMQGTPQTMQEQPRYNDVVGEVAAFLEARRQAAVQSGIPSSHILFDPGYGFGKTTAHNIALINGLPRLAEQAPVLIGLSRKGMIGSMMGDKQADRTVGSVMAAMLCIQKGARIVRVHDVQPTAQALAVMLAIEEGAVAH